MNDRINRTIRPEADHGDVWTAHAVIGDCEDYALAKRAALLSAGWAPSQLLIAVVETRQSESHAVLIARTDQGDLVLDNLEPEIRRWDRTGLTFRSRQSERLPIMWVKL